MKFHYRNSSNLHIQYTVVLISEGFFQFIVLRELQLYWLYFFQTENPTKLEELDDSVYDIKRERVRPDHLKKIMQTKKPGSTIAPTVFSPHRRASIHRMKDRYRSQLLNQGIQQETEKETENETENKNQETENLPATTTSRTDLPTKRRRLPSKPASESVRPTYKVIQDHKTTDNKKC